MKIKHLLGAFRSVVMPLADFQQVSLFLERIDNVIEDSSGVDLAHEQIILYKKSTKFFIGRDILGTNSSLLCLDDIEVFDIDAAEYTFRTVKVDSYLDLEASLSRDSKLKRIVLKNKLVDIYEL